MIKKIWIKIIKHFLFAIYFFNKKKKYRIREYEFNFENIIFSNYSDLKKKFLSHNEVYNKYSNEKNHSFHLFDWLSVAKSIGGAENVLKAKKTIIKWHKNKYSKNYYIWSTLFSSKRFINLIYNYDFYAVSASKLEKEIIHNIILEHYLLVKLEVEKDLKKFNIEHFKSVFLGSLIYNDNIKESVKILSLILSLQIDNNGFHKSYNPLEQAKFLNNLHQIKSMTLFFKVKTPLDLNFQITNLTSTLITLLHKDHSLPLFNGSNNMFYEEVQSLINQIKDIIPKKPKDINKGIAIYNDDDKKIIMDIVQPTNNILNNNLHASTLAFEFSCKNEKIITNCGSIEKKIGKNPDYLRFSAAHSTIILNNTNISELVIKKSYKRIPKKILFSSDETDEYMSWSSSHDGYLQNFHKIVKRKILISKKNNEIFGEDSIISNKVGLEKNVFSIRFHLMPECNCIITNNYHSVIIRTKNGQNWIFKSDSKIALEDSIYVGKGKSVEQNKQIVINGTVHDNKVIKKWSLIKS